MKILFFIDHLRADGTQRVLCQLIEKMTAHGHKMAVVCLNNSWDAPLITLLRQHGVTVIIIGKARLLSGYGFVSTLRWIRCESFDVAVTMLFVSDVVGRALAYAAGIPRIVSSIRARNVNYRLWQLWLVRSTMRWADAVIVNSKATCAFATAAEGAPPERLIYIPNGVAPENYTSPMSRTALRADLGLAPETRLIGAVGRLTYQKGVDVLLKALAASALIDAHLLVVGAGEEEERLQAQADALGLTARVHLLGYRRDVPQLLGALDLYVHPARFEGMPNALLEAMAAGCPIVATATDGNVELIADGVHGWLAPPADPNALSAALSAALNDPLEARRRGDAARRRAVASFSVATMATAWERVLAGADIHQSVSL
jgi:glycosyltransferase involved in cell wall biosynthesis